MYVRLQLEPFDAIDPDDDDLIVELLVQPDIAAEHVERLRDNLQFLTDHPDRHQQNIYFELGEAHMPTERPRAGTYVPVIRPESGSIDNCGTVGCLAGWTVLREPSIPLIVSYGGASYPGEQVNGRWIRRTTDDVAVELLGLDGGNASTLFSASNTIGDLWRIAAVITAGAVVVPEVHRIVEHQHDAQAVLFIDPTATVIVESLRARRSVGNSGEICPF
jgi:hypothetical protein